MSKTTFQTNIRSLKTPEKTKICLIFSPLYADRIIEHTFILVDDAALNYYVVLGTNLMQELGIDVLFSSNELRWNDVTMPSTSSDATLTTNNLLKNSDAVRQSVPRITKKNSILHTKKLTFSSSASEQKIAALTSDKRCLALSRVSQHSIYQRRMERSVHHNFFKRSKRSQKKPYSKDNGGETKMSVECIALHLLQWIE